MNIDSKKLFSDCLEQASQVVYQVTPADFSHKTPDSEWNVKQLLKHMYYELSWIKEIVTGRTIKEVGTKYDLLAINENIAKDWRLEGAKALRAVNEADLTTTTTVHLSYGDTKAEDYIKQVAGELAIHAWDLSIGINKPLTFNSRIVNELYDIAKPRAAMMSRSGLFDPVVNTNNDNSNMQTKLLALYGRKNKV